MTCSRVRLRPLAQAGWTSDQILDALTLDDIRAAADVLRLAEQVRARVQDARGITLELEVKLLGEF